MFIVNQSVEIKVILNNLLSNSSSILCVSINVFVISVLAIMFLRPDYKSILHDRLWDRFFPLTLFLIDIWRWCFQATGAANAEEFTPGWILCDIIYATSAVYHHVSNAHIVLTNQSEKGTWRDILGASIFIFREQNFRLYLISECNLFSYRVLYRNVSSYL